MGVDHRGHHRKEPGRLFSFLRARLPAHPARVSDQVLETSGATRLGDGARLHRPRPEPRHPRSLLQRGGVGSAWIADPWAPALSLSRAPLDFEVSTPALPAFTADVGFVGEVPDPLRVSLSP